MDRAQRRLSSLRQEGVIHEQAFILDGEDGPILAWVTEAEDIDRARRSYVHASLPIGRELER